MKKLLYILLFVPFAFIGQDNYSLSFDGVDDYIEIGELNGLVPTSSHTFIVYEKHEEGGQCSHKGFVFGERCYTGQNQCLHYGYRGCGDSGCDLGDCMGLDFFGDGLISESISSSEWNLWIFTYNHNTFERKIYQNGNLIISDISYGYYGVLDLLIGTSGVANYGHYFIGILDNILIYNYVLSDNEIQNYLTLSPPELGLVGFWDFNEGSGDTVYDLSGNGNHGIIHGATYSNDIPEQNWIEGCTDSLAENYNSEAFSDNETCEYILGCTEPNAGNYNQLATQNDGSCISQEEYTIDSLNNVVEQATTSLSSLQQALDTWNTTIDLSAGWNIIGYGCPSSINVADGLSNHTESIIITKANNGNVYMPEFGFNGIGDFTPGFGYQIKLTEAIDSFSLCDWYVNNIPEDNIISLQDYIVQLEDSIELLNTTYEIGDFALGGIVFYVDETGQHGLVAAMEDLPNTYEWVTAAQATINSESEGYNDWYLPSSDELQEMCNTIHSSALEGNILGFVNNSYWSSSNIDGNSAFQVHFNSCEILVAGKNFSFRVRPIRSF